MLMVVEAADALRPPHDQISVRAYAGLVGIYQSHISPGLRSHIRCRYQPTCSEYSRQAVERHGIAHGLLLSGQRALSCRESVPIGTPDPVP